MVSRTFKKIITIRLDDRLTVVGCGTLIRIHARYIVHSRNRMQEVRVPTETITVLLNLTQIFALRFVVLLPGFIAVMRPSVLKATQNVPILVGHTGNLLYANSTIERLI